MTTMEKVCNIIMKLKKKDLSREDLQPEALLVEQLKFDSLDISELLVLTEDEFGIEVNPDDLRSLTDISSVVVYLDKRLSE